MELSKKFTDALKREWLILLPWTTEQRVMAETGITLDDLIPQADGKPAARPLHELIMDRKAMFSILWAIFRPECEKKGITQEQFGEGFDGTAFVAAGLAFMAALHDFFPHPLRQAMVKQMLTKGTEAIAHAVTRLNEHLDQINVPEALDAEALRNGFTIVPASPTLTPDPTP